MEETADATWLRVRIIVPTATCANFAVQLSATHEGGEVLFVLMVPDGAVPGEALVTVPVRLVPACPSAPPPPPVAHTELPQDQLGGSSRASRATGVWVPQGGGPLNLPVSSSCVIVSVSQAKPCLPSLRPPSLARSGAMTKTTKVACWVTPKALRPRGWAASGAPGSCTTTPSEGTGDKSTELDAGAAADSPASCTAMPSASMGGTSPGWGRARARVWQPLPPQAAPRRRAPARGTNLRGRARARQPLPVQDWTTQAIGQQHTSPLRAGCEARRREIVVIFGCGNGLARDAPELHQHAELNGAGCGRGSRLPRKLHRDAELQHRGQADGGRARARQPLPPQAPPRRRARAWGGTSSGRGAGVAASSSGATGPSGKSRPHKFFLLFIFIWAKQNYTN